MTDKKAESIVQDFGSLAPVRIGLSAEVRAKSVRALNRLLAHTMAMRDSYKKAHWQTAGATFYELHLLFDKHYGEQAALMDSIAERIQTLGGVTIALPGDVVSESSIARAPRGRESARAQLDRLANGHETVLLDARPLAREASDAGDDGTNDLIVSEVVRTNELQCWFIVQHLSRHSELGDLPSADPSA
ncbi:DNA starvation/stationary phase protection protein [Massilia terrae]|uniref:DNA starvation/stationary phase protection protein n=1 Tax=Massilia terrae TaxID=1811224 RepID=A0ABT2CTY9_9BURK|nr:DNA starvation/stationary phase protection protein [Massilia terrae]MCS0657442.1 DNA starvation/stationary phase protection protein [Massilia terrae]